MNVKSAELVNDAANDMIVTRLSVQNELASGVHVLAIVTKRKKIRAPELGDIEATLRTTVLFDWPQRL